MLLSNKCIQFLCTHTHQDNTQKSAHLLSCFDIQLLMLPTKRLTAKVKRGQHFLSPFLKSPGKIPNSWSLWWNVCPHLLCLNITCLVSKVTQITGTNHQVSESVTFPNPFSFCLLQLPVLLARIKDCLHFQLNTHFHYIFLLCSLFFLPLQRQENLTHKYTHSHTHYQ